MKNILRNGFIIDASVELVPKISISPFHEVFYNTEDNSEISIAEEYLNRRFGTYKLFLKARNAIYAVLKSFDLEKDDVVSIFTTSGNFYISSCVTKEIEKVCKWSREISEKTKVIFINHEFGYPMSISDYTKLLELKTKNPALKIIEDCAHTFFTNSNVIGSQADYVIYSLPKSFSMQIGSILVSNRHNLEKEFLDNRLDNDYRNYVLSSFSQYVRNIEEYKTKQIQNYEYLKSKLEQLGIKPFFKKHTIEKNEIVPSVFLFSWNDKIDYPKLKEFMQSNGVESSVFYGKNAFFIPCNYALTKDELDYMIALLEYFYSTNKSNIETGV